MNPNLQRVLFVDDDQAILDAIRRRFRGVYDISTACGPIAGMQAVMDGAPFAVVVSDFKMPDMNGARFLANIRAHSPETVRVMLTGQADMQAAADAVNQGAIFRFLTKPCESQELRTCIDAAIDQYRLQNAERDLLQQTVRGCVEVLADVLALTNPDAFGRAIRIRDVVRHVIRHMGRDDGWQYETAALLSQLGYVAIPDGLLDRALTGQELGSEEAAMLGKHPEVARDLLLKIPRLETVAEIVYQQFEESEQRVSEFVAYGGQVLASAVEYVDLLGVGATHQQAVRALDRSERFDAEIVAALAAAPQSREQTATVSLPVQRFGVGMIIHEDIRNLAGSLVVSAGHRITEGSVHRLRNFAELGYLEKEEYLVRVKKSVALGSSAA